MRFIDFDSMLIPADKFRLLIEDKCANQTALKPQIYNFILVISRVILNFEYRSITIQK